MSSPLRSQDFIPSCPLGGEFYVYNTGSQFVGCCISEACNSGCTYGNLEPASFDSSYHGRFPDQECSSGSRWYMCAATRPPFMGCCKSDPCNGGCPIGGLTAGLLLSNPYLVAPFSPLRASSLATLLSRTASAIITPDPNTTVPPEGITTTPSISNPLTSASARLAGTPPTIASSHPPPQSDICYISVGVVAGIMVLVFAAILLLSHYRDKTTATSGEPRAERRRLRRFRPFRTSRWRSAYSASHSASVFNA